MKISVTTIGCKLNFSESATIVRDFIETGQFQQVEFGEQADVTIINSCSVTAQAERKSRYAAKKAAKVSPNGVVAIIGCSAQLRPESFERIEGVDYILGTKDKFKLIDLLEEKSKKQTHSCNINAVTNFDNSYSLSARTRSFLKIQDGCNYGCSYCTIPEARGKSRNGRIEDIVSEVNTIAKNGVKEIILTGVNIGDFGRTTNESFFDLLKEIVAVEGIERLRISSIEPNLLTDEILQLAVDSGKIMPHFHIPLQSGSDSVLKNMRRRYNTKMFREKILKVNKLLPDAYIGIDVIVGFPTETEQHFDETYKLLSDLPISFLHIFPYSDRPGTVATSIFPKVPSEWIKKREKLLQELSNKKQFEFYKRFENSTRKVLFEATSNQNYIFGYTDNYLWVKVKSTDIKPNTIHSVKLLNSNNTFLDGKVIF